MIAIVDYGRGNLGSVRKALAELLPEVVVTDDARIVARARALVVPGDGAFADAMGSLERLGLVDPIRAHVAAGRPYLGICLGYQLLFTESEEFGHAKGLDVLPGTVRRFPPGLKVPHMGWNQLWHDETLPLLAGIPTGTYFYFVHSYYPDVSDALRRGGRADRSLRVRAPLPGAGRARRALRHPVPSGEEPGLGAQAAGELRPARGRRGGRASVIVIPAIDLKGGRCVRLVEGRADTATVFGDDPVAMARRWAERGARRLHVVDLDGAFDGAPRHAEVIRAIVKTVPSVPVEVGGGLRDLGALEAALGTGARWAVLGTAAALDPAVLDAACARWPDRILVGVDAIDGRVAVRGWTDVLPLAAHELASRAAVAGAAGVIYTDVRRDGTGRGPNLEATAALAAGTPVPVIASGGIAGLDDLVHLAAIPNVAGAIVGRALYTGAVDLEAANALVAA